MRDKHLSFLSQAVSSQTAGYNPWLFSLQVTVILENLFDPDEIIAEPTLLKDLDADIKEESATLGPVEKVESSSESFYLGRFVSQYGRPFLPASMRLCTTERVREVLQPWCERHVGLLSATFSESIKSFTVVNS